ncbi:MAG: ATP-binding cassette domain-containing protein [Nitrosomonas sp.]|nr:ATP-binding cassette domain-containing protein [Nitrosomonas sp.]
MKILGKDLEPTSGNISVDNNERVGKLRQDQFAFEEFIVLDTVMMGHEELWQIKKQRDLIYANPTATEEDYLLAAELESEFAELDGYSAEARAGELLLGVGIPSLTSLSDECHCTGFKLRVLVAQALFSNPDILLLDEPTNNFDINTIRWLEEINNS